MLSVSRNLSPVFCKHHYSRTECLLDVAKDDPFGPETFSKFFRVLSMKLCHLLCCSCSTEVKNFIHWLLDTNPFNCPTLREILKHPWIAQQTN